MRDWWCYETGIIIEEARYYRKIGSEFYVQINSGIGGFTLSEEDKILNLDKKASVILSPLGLNFDDSLIIKKIYKDLESIDIEEEYVGTQEISGEIEKYVLNLAEYLDYDIEMNDSIDL